MVNHFLAIDVETANNQRGSICQIGLTRFEAATPNWEWSTLVNPEQDFDDFNVRIHGIASATVCSAPVWPDVFAHIGETISQHVVVSHTRFDYDALAGASKRYGLVLPMCQWLDTCAVARIAWPDLPSHDLKSLSRRFSISLNHHDALSDARAAGNVLARAIADTGIHLSGWLDRAAVRGDGASGHRQRQYSPQVEIAANPNGPLAGHVWVCTGLFDIGEAALARMAADLGCEVKENVTKTTSMFIIGKRDPDQFGGKPKSTKHLKVEEAIATGRQIMVMTEREFIEFTQQYAGLNLAMAS